MLDSLLAHSIEEYSDCARLTLQLNLVLHNEGLALVVNLLGEFGRDRMMSSGVLDNKALVSIDAFVLSRLFDSPLADICPFFFGLVRTSHILLGVGRLPSLIPIIGELLKEVRLQRGGL